ncbi:MAG: FeoA family protein [Actinomycetota bacterium]|nr:FeoA family protein [Actinomycetota bacterium]
MSQNEQIPLAFLTEGEVGTVAGFRGMRHQGTRSEGEYSREAKQYRRGHLHHSDRGHRIEHRLQQMGIQVGKKIRVIANNAPGPILVASGDTRICLGRGLAMHIMVRLDTHSPEVS